MSLRTNYFNRRNGNLRLHNFTTQKDFTNFIISGGGGNYNKQKLTDKLYCIGEPHSQVRATVIGHGNGHIDEAVQLWKLRGGYVE